MGKGITGLDRTQLSCLVEMVLGDTEISLAPRILGPLAAVRATLMYLRTNTSQEAIAEIMGVSQPTISRAISVVTRIIARVLGPVLATVEEVPHGGVHIIDGTLLPCWSWKDRTDLWSGKHKRTGLSLQVLVSPAGRLRWASDLTWLIVGWLGCWGLVVVGIVGGLRGLGCALTWGYESVRSHGQDGVGGPCGADRALLPEGGAQHRAHWLGP